MNKQTAGVELPELPPIDDYLPQDGPRWTTENFIKAVQSYSVDYAAVAMLADREKQAARFTLSEEAQEWIGRWLVADMEMAVRNGANSVSMPNHLVEIAVWLESKHTEADRQKREAQVDERAEFEAWWKGELKDWRGHESLPARHAWSGWQARASLKGKP